MEFNRIDRTPGGRHGTFFDDFALVYGNIYIIQIAMLVICFVGRGSTAAESTGVHVTGNFDGEKPEIAYVAHIHFLAIVGIDVCHT